MRIKPKVLLLFFLLFHFCLNSFAQKDKRLQEGTVVKMVYEGNDTLPMVTLDAVNIFGERKFKSKKEEKQYGRLKRYVQTVYPYAKLAGEMVRDFEDTLSKIKNEAKRKAYMKEAEDKLKEEFEGQLQELTIGQGIILIKLIDRETGSTSYDLIKQLRGSFTAFIWQTVARLFSTNLKLQYDPTGEDVLIEELVTQIELGYLPYYPIKRKDGK